MGNSVISYWRWFFKGSGAKPGYRRLVNTWIMIHLIVGVIVSFVVPVNLENAANTVLLPLVGILIGLSFAWAGNAQALLQSSEIDKLSEHHEGGFIEYVFTYQGERIKRGISDSLRAAVKKAGLENVTLHTLRHTFASQLVTVGVPLRYVQELMGHKRIETTMKYLHSDNEAKENAVEGAFG